MDELESERTGRRKMTWEDPKLEQAYLAAELGDRIVARGNNIIQTDDYLEYAKKVEKQVLGWKIKEMIKQLHPELPNDVELKLPENHPPKDANWLKSSLADRYPEAIDHLIDRFNQKKIYNMRGGVKQKKNKLTTKEQTSESGRGINLFSTQIGRSGNLNTSSSSHHQERQRTNRSSIYQESGGQNNSKLSELPINPPTTESSQSGRRVEAFRPPISFVSKRSTEVKRTKLMMEDLKAVTVTEAKYSHRHELDTNLSYKAMMASKRELDKHIASSEEKRRKTELGGFVTSVDHGDTTKDPELFGVSNTLFKTWRAESVTNKTAASSLDATMKTQQTNYTARKTRQTQNQSFSDCNKLADKIRSEFFDNILSGDYAANETSFGRKFFLAFDWMRKKTYLELETFDDQTGRIFYNRRNLNQRELETERAAQALKTVERSLLRTAGASSKVKMLISASIDAQQTAHRNITRVSFSVPLTKATIPSLERNSIQADKTDPDLEDDKSTSSHFSKGTSSNRSQKRTVPLKEIHAINEKIRVVSSNLTKVAKENLGYFRIKSEKQQQLRDVLEVRQKDNGLKSELENKVIAQSLGVKQTGFLKVRKQAEDVRTSLYKDAKFQSLVEVYKSTLQFTVSNLKFVDLAADIIGGLMDYLRLLLTEGVTPTSEDARNMEYFVNEMKEKIPDFRNATPTELRIIHTLIKEVSAV